MGLFDPPSASSLSGSSRVQVGFGEITERGTKNYLTSKFPEGYCEWVTQCPSCLAGGYHQFSHEAQIGEFIPTHPETSHFFLITLP